MEILFENVIYHAITVIDNFVWSPPGDNVLNKILLCGRSNGC